MSETWSTAMQDDPESELRATPYVLVHFLYCERINARVVRFFISMLGVLNILNFLGDYDQLRNRCLQVIGALITYLKKIGFYVSNFNKFVTLFLRTGSGCIFFRIYLWKFESIKLCRYCWKCIFISLWWATTQRVVKVSLKILMNVLLNVSSLQISFTLHTPPMYFPYNYFFQCRKSIFNFF